MSAAPDGSAGVASTRVRTPLQPDVRVPRGQGASLRRHPLRVRLRRPDAHRSTAALRTRTRPASAAGLRSIGQCRAANVRRRETTTSTRQRPRMAVMRVPGGAAGSQLSRAELAQRTESGRSGSQPRDARSGSDGGGSPVRLSRARAFPTHRGFWLEDRPRAQRARTIGPTAVSGTIPAVGPRASGSGQGRPSGGIGLAVESSLAFWRWIGRTRRVPRGGRG